MTATIGKLITEPQLVLCPLSSTIHSKFPLPTVVTLADLGGFPDGMTQTYIPEGSKKNPTLSV